MNERMKKKIQKQPQQKKYVTEEDILRKHHQFIRQSESDSDGDNSDSNSRDRSRNKKENCYERYGEEMSKKYYSKLYKQYALVDLSRFETGQIGCRWRTQKQVLSDKGEKMCGSVDCSQPSTQTFEMNFGYTESGKKKNALVKVSLCDKCEKKLNYRKSHKKVPQTEKNLQIQSKQVQASKI